MIGLGEQIIHLAVHIHHVLLCPINIVSQLLNTDILPLNLRVEVLGLVLSGLDDPNNLIKLIILVAQHVFLVCQDLLIAEAKVRAGEDRHRTAREIGKGNRMATHLFTCEGDLS